MSGKKLVRIVTAGSVDDGKSTLIGRLLFETGSLTEDKIDAIKISSQNKGYDYLDLSLATDGLLAEREQGITIDVAHIYFTNDDVNFIIADAPGHEEYTRNMITGASNAQVALILIDARKGITEQTYRHLFICNLLKIDSIIFAINKMDKVDFSKDVFDKIVNDIEAVSQRAGMDDTKVNYIPVSALCGDNVTALSDNMSWYAGGTLLDVLKEIEPRTKSADLPFRFPVQYVVRPKVEEFHDYRSYTGKIMSGSISVDDEVTVLPSGNKARVKAISFHNQTFDTADAGAVPAIILDRELNISRGDMLVKGTADCLIENQLQATVCQINKTPLKAGNKYILQHGTNRVRVKVNEGINKLKTDYTGNVPAEELVLNEIGTLAMNLSKPLYADTYAQNKKNGHFILIDEQTNETTAVGFIV